MRTNHVVDACCVHLNVLQLPACFFTCPIGIAGMVEMMNTMSMCVRPATTSKRTPEVTKRRKSHRTGNVLIHCHVSHLNQPGTSWTCQENGPPSLPEVDLARLEGNQVREKAALSAAVAATSEASYVCIFYQQIFQQFFGDDVYSIFSPTQPLFFLYMLISASDLWMFVSGQQSKDVFCKHVESVLSKSAKIRSLVGDLQRNYPTDPTARKFLSFKHVQEILCSFLVVKKTANYCKSKPKIPIFTHSPPFYQGRGHLEWWSQHLGQWVQHPFQPHGRRRAG